MRTLIPFALLLALALAACGGTDTTPARTGVSADGGACEMPAQGQHGSAGAYSYVIWQACPGYAGVCPDPGFNASFCALTDYYPSFCTAAESHPQGCAAVRTEFCCLR